MNYGIKMKELREIYALTQKEVAGILNIARSTYKQYEVQYDIIPLKHLNTFCNHFKVSIDYIFSFTTLKSYSDEVEEISVPISSARMKEVRTEFNYTQKKLAAKINVANTMISEYEKGHFMVSTATLYALCKEFSVSSDYLLGKTNKVKYLKQKPLIKN